jgi:hypothetical protein
MLCNEPTSGFTSQSPFSDFRFPGRTNNENTKRVRSELKNVLCGCAIALSNIAAPLFTVEKDSYDSAHGHSAKSGHLGPLRQLSTHALCSGWAFEAGVERNRYRGCNCLAELLPLQLRALVVAQPLPQAVRRRGAGLADVEAAVIRDVEQDQLRLRVVAGELAALSTPRHSAAEIALSQ